MNTKNTHIDTHTHIVDDVRPVTRNSAFCLTYRVRCIYMQSKAAGQIIVFASGGRLVGGILLKKITIIIVYGFFFVSFSVVFVYNAYGVICVCTYTTDV